MSGKGKSVKNADRPTRLAEVLRLSLMEGKGKNQIARETGLNRKTVRRLLEVAANPKAESKGAARRPSLLDAHEADLRRLLEESADIRAPAVLDRLRANGYRGGLSIVRDRLRQMRPRPAREAFFTRDYAPGRMLQVDWANFGYAIPGCARQVSAFVAALAYSRLLFVVFTLSQAMGCFLRCMDRALEFFGGRTLVDLFDNMKTVVKERTAQQVVFNPRFVEYARVRGIAIQACPPRRPTGKPYVERPIGFVRTRFWPGRRFTSLFDLNAQATRWRDEIANNRIHEQTGKVPSLVFKNEEQRTLAPLLNGYLDTDDIESTGSSKTFRVTFDRNRYSVPWRLAQQSVLVRGNDERVSIFLGHKLIAVHNRSWGAGEIIADGAHEEGLLEKKPRAAAGALPPELQGLGESAVEYFKILAANGRSLHREVLRLVLLSELFGSANTSSAIGQVMATGHVGAEYVEYVLRHKKGLPPGPSPLRLGNPDLDGIRLGEPDLSSYDLPRKTLDPGDPPAGDDDET
jgi:transposase